MEITDEKETQKNNKKIKTKTEKDKERGRGGERGGRSYSEGVRAK